MCGVAGACGDFNKALEAKLPSFCHKEYTLTHMQQHPRLFINMAYKSTHEIFEGIHL